MKMTELRWEGHVLMVVSWSIFSDMNGIFEKKVYNDL